MTINKNGDSLILEFKPVDMKGNIINNITSATIKFKPTNKTFGITVDNSEPAFKLSYALNPRDFSSGVFNGLISVSCSRGGFTTTNPMQINII